MEWVCDPPFVRLFASMQLEASTPGKEETFRAAVEEEWNILASQKVDDDNESSRSPPESSRDSSHEEKPTSTVRSPFIVCTDRHPSAVSAVEEKIGCVHTQLVYSGGDSACVLAALSLEDVVAVQKTARVRFVEPIPHPAKLSRSLHAELKPGVEKKTHESDQPLSRGRRGHGIRRQLQRKIHFLGGGDRLPGDLEVTLTPGTWGIGIVREWLRHLASFDSIADLWGEHLRERFLWTRSILDAQPEVLRTREGSNGTRNEGDDETTPSFPNKMVREHGLHQTVGLWEHVVERSSREGVCRLERLALSAEDNQSGAWAHGGGSDEGSAFSPGRGDHSRRRAEYGDAHDRVILRGAGSLGVQAQDSDHCLLTLIAYIVTRPEVSWVAELPSISPLNIEAAWITQSAKKTSYPIWEQGIDGRTEVRSACARCVIHDTVVLK